MRVLVCGSRTFTDEKKMKEVLDGYKITTVIEGEARGADTLSRLYAEQRGIPVESYPADWSLHGKGAGHIRNSRMLTEGKPDLCVAFLGPVAISEFTSGLSDSKYSKGTKNMIDQATKAGVPVKVIDVE